MKIIRKLLIGIITLAAMAVLCAVCAGAETYGDYVYTVLDDGTIKITDYNGTDTNVTVPSYIGGKRVTIIGGSSFSFNSTIESISIPGTVKSIGEYAFDKCTSLTTVNLPSSVTTLDNYSFQRCSSLKSIDIPSSVTSIGSGAFEECTALTSITIPSGVKTIDAATFSFCSSLRSISLPDSLTSIGNYAFQKCSKLSSITLPEGMKKIGMYAFDNCSSLAYITVPSSVTEIGQAALGYYYNEESSKYEVKSQFRIYCYLGTKGETYAKNNAISYTLLDAPKAMSDFNVSPKSTTSVTLCWSQNTSATGYIIEQYIDSEWTQIAKLTSNSTVSYDISGLTPLKIYKFRIKAYYTNNNATAYSEYTEASGTTKLSNMSGVTATSTSNTVTLSWNKNDSATGYFIQQYKNGAWTHIRQLARNTVLSYTATGLTPSTKYQFRIRAYYTNGSTTTYSDYKYASPTTRPNNLTGVTATSTANSVTLSWDKNDSATGYFIQQYKDGKWTHIRQLARNTVLSYTATGLTPSTKYQFRIRAYYTDGVSTTYSDYKYASPTTRPNNLTGVKATSTANTVTLSWNKNDTATGYFIQQYKDGKWTHIRQLARNTVLSYTATGLTPSTSYQFRIRAYYTNGSTTTYSDYKTISCKTMS